MRGCQLQDLHESSLLCDFGSRETCWGKVFVDVFFPSGMGTVDFSTPIIKPDSISGMESGRLQLRRETLFFIPQPSVHVSEGRKYGRSLQELMI